LNPYLKIIRIPNILIILFTMVLLRICVIDIWFGLSNSVSALSYFEFVLLVFATVFIAAGGYVINDYFDQDIDLINKPDKVIVGKSISIKRIWIYYWIITVLGVIIGFYLAIKVDFYQLGLIFPAVAIMLWSYSSKYQKKVLIGNIMIATMSALVIIVLWLFEFFAKKADPVDFVNVMGQIESLHLIVFAYGLFAFFVSLIREIVKDVEDYEGDKEGGFKTLTIVFGRKFALNLAAVLHVLTMLFLAAGQYLLYMNDFLLVFWYVTIAVQLLFFFVLYFVLTARTKKEFHFLSDAYKVIMLAGILSMQLFYISF